MVRRREQTAQRRTTLPAIRPATAWARPVARQGGPADTAHLAACDDAPADDVRFHDRVDETLPSSPRGGTRCEWVTRATSTRVSAWMQGLIRKTSFVHQCRRGAGLTDVFA
jgi:hypothetical protein